MPNNTIPDIDLQKFMNFMIFQEYRAYTQEVTTMNVINQDTDGFPKTPIPYNQFLKENDLLAE